MKLFKFFILVVFIIPSLQFNLFSTITSRVEGFVTDEETGEPLKDSTVFLFTCNLISKYIEFYSDKSLMADSKGYFKFDDLNEGYYFLSVFKKDYSAIGPIYVHNEDDLEFVARRDIYPQNSKIDKFFLKQGQIKHFKIKLKKEACLELVVLQKTSEGISDFWNDVDFSINHPGFIDPITAEHCNKFIFHFMKEGKLDIKIKPIGYISKEYREIEITSGENKRIEYVADFTKGQSLKIIIKYRETKKPMKLVNVYLVKFDEPGKNFNATVFTNDTGEAWFGGFEPGTFYLLISSHGVNTGKKFKFEDNIKIKPNEKKELYKEF